MMLTQGRFCAQQSARSIKHNARVLCFSSMHRCQNGGRPRLSIKVAKEVARARGGACLSDQYMGTMKHLRWQCGKGHEWNASLNSVKDKESWCPHCARRARLSINDATAAAVAKGGRCLSKVYKNCRTHLQWQCAEGHEWKASLKNVRHNGIWCPVCRPLLSLSVAKEIAKVRGGTCLSDQYLGISTSLRWQCAKGHEWDASLNSVKDKQSWCPHCARRSRRSHHDAIAVAAAKGGRCLSKMYGNCHTLLLWQCADGHEWKASLVSVRHHGIWCPVCYFSRARRCRRLTLADAAHAAAIHGGTCLSESYVNIRSPLLWQCSEGHQWWSVLHNIRRGSWCPECAIARTRLNLAVAMDVAVARGGLCVSSKYINNATHLRWRCKRGHEWQATLHSIKNGGTWCPECAHPKSQRHVRDIFQAIFLGFIFPTCRPAFLRGQKGQPLELDGYCVALQLAFEYQGEQHYHRNTYWNQKLSDQKFQESIARDSLKVSLCEAFGVRLVVVPYMVKDRWNFIRFNLLRWFPVSAIFPPALPRSVLD